MFCRFFNNYSFNYLWLFFFTFNTNGEKTYQLGAGTYLMVIFRPNSGAFGVYVLFQNRVNVVYENATSGTWDSLAFTNGVFSMNVKNTYANIGYIRFG